jgi:hypothetical protein
MQRIKTKVKDILKLRESAWFLSSFVINYVYQHESVFILEKWGVFWWKKRKKK